MRQKWGGIFVQILGGGFFSLEMVEIEVEGKHGMALEHGLDLGLVVDEGRLELHDVQTTGHPELMKLIEEGAEQFVKVKTSTKIELQLALLKGVQDELGDVDADDRKRVPMRVGVAEDALAGAVGIVLCKVDEVVEAETAHATEVSGRARRLLESNRGPVALKRVRHQLCPQPIEERLMLRPDERGASPRSAFVDKGAYLDNASYAGL